MARLQSGCPLCTRFLALVERVKRRAEREGIEPQADLGQLHGHRVEIDAINAALEDVALEQIDVSQLLVIDEYTLLAQRLIDALTGAMQGEIHRVNRT